MNKLNDTPMANRLHIAFYGRRNSGKSSLVNRITNQNIALVSDTPGTTTDPVYKSMELLPIGPVAIIDTAGLDDEGGIGQLRVKKSIDVMDKTDLAVLVFTSESKDGALEKEWHDTLKKKGINTVLVYNKIDEDDSNLKELQDIFKEQFVTVSAKENINIDKLKERIISLVPEEYEKKTITGHLVEENDTVLLVMPQDIQAPKGRLILPQVQVIRDLLDNNAIVISVKEEQMRKAIKDNSNIKVIITDSQIFDKVKEVTPAGVKLTSFSMIMAEYKGDMDEFQKGAKAIDLLKAGDKVLIAEACTHHPLEGDIARKKLPNMINEYLGYDIVFDNVAGQEFPDNLEEYKLIIHCGACMFNRKQMMSRIEKAREKNVPITNFGVAISHMKKIYE